MGRGVRQKTINRIVFSPLPLTCEKWEYIYIYITIKYMLVKQQQQQQQQRPPTTRQGIRLQTGSPKRVICLGTQPQPDTQTHQPLLPLLKGAVSQRIQAESQLSQTYSQDEFTSHTNSKDKGQKVDHNSKYLNLLASFQKIYMSMKIARITYNYRLCLSLAY